MKGTTPTKRHWFPDKKGKIAANFVNGGLYLYVETYAVNREIGQDVFEKFRRWYSFAEFFSLQFRVFMFPLTPIIYVWDVISNIILDPLLLVIYGSELNGNI